MGMTDISKTQSAGELLELIREKIHTPSNSTGTKSAALSGAETQGM
jgi:hypothetical protein